MICKSTWPGDKKTPRYQQDTKSILSSYGSKIPEDEFRLGNSKVFLKNPTTLFFLEEEREKAIPRVVTLMQSAWRGYKARLLARRLKAAIMIQKIYKGYKVRMDYKQNRVKFLKQKAGTRLLVAFRRYKLKKYLLAIAKVYSNILTEKLWGKFLQWPKRTKFPANIESHIAVFEDILKRVYAKYRAVKMVKSLSADQQQEMRQKVSAYNIFYGKKPWDCARKYTADYLEGDSNPGKEKYLAGMTNLLAKFGDTEVLFSDYVNKVNRKGKSQKRAITVTDKNVYKQDPNNYKVKKGEIPLSQITSISLSPNKDTFVFLHTQTPYRDMVVDLGFTGIEKYSEFVTVIMDQIKKLKDTVPPVNFTNNVKYNNSREAKSPGTDCTCTFQPSTDPKQVLSSAFKNGKSNANIISFK